MKTEKIIIISILVFLAAGALAFFLEDYYEKGIRYLYETLTDHSISFFLPAKYFNFPSGLFMFSFAVFSTFIYYILADQAGRKIAIVVSLTIIAFICSTMLICSFDGTSKLISCTACNDGRRILNYRDINYDAVFISSLIMATIPVVVSEINRRRKNRKSHSADVHA